LNPIDQPAAILALDEDDDVERIAGGDFGRDPAIGNDLGIDAAIGMTVSVHQHAWYRQIADRGVDRVGLDLRWQAARAWRRESTLRD